MQEKTSILAATTPQDNTTYNAYLINLKDPETGESIFNVVHLFEVCDDCRGTPHAWQCNHAPDRISGSKTRKSRTESLLFYQDGDEEIGGRELFGVGNKNSNNLLLSEVITKFRESVVEIRNPVRALYLGIDPGGGGPGDLGICGIVETMTESGSFLAVSFISFLLSVEAGLWA